MKKVNSTPLRPADLFSSHVELTHIAYEWGRLVVTLTSGGDSRTVTATFSDIIGFRMLDEGDLLEFWPACAQQEGWLFQVHSNGWFDLESSRSGFLHGKTEGVIEYFIASGNGCVSVLSGEEPVVSSYSI